MTNKLVALVGGGAGNIGIGIVRQLLNVGAIVYVPSRDQARLDKLADYVRDVPSGKMIPIQIDISQLEQAEALIADIARINGRLDVAVASLGGWWTGPPLAKIPLVDWQSLLDSNLTAHFILARAVVPQLQMQGSGTYVAIAGPGNVLYAPNSTLMNIVGQAQVQLIENLAREARPQGVQVYQLFIANILTRERPHLQGGRPGWITPEQVGERVLALHQGLIDNPESVRQLYVPFELAELLKSML